MIVKDPNKLPLPIRGKWYRLKRGKYGERYFCAICGCKVWERQEQCPNCLNEMEMPKEDWIEQYRNLKTETDPLCMGTIRIMDEHGNLR